MTWWRRWIRQPRSLALRKFIFQVHVWAGVGLGLYMFMISVTGSILVYRSELYRTFSSGPTIVERSGPLLSDEALSERIRQRYPDHQVRTLRRGKEETHAVEATLDAGGATRLRLFNPFTGADLGHPLTIGFRLTSWMLDLHDNLLFGPTGRRVNGIGAGALVLLGVTGLFIWWPGIASWRRSLTIDRRANWKRFNWSLHSALGFWFVGFILLWGVTGLYLSYASTFAEWFDWIQPLDETNPVERLVDRVQYWLAYLHFGRLGGRGIPGCGRGWCDATTKATWAAIAIVPPVMVVTGLVMWWNRVVRPAARSAAASASAST